MPTEPPPTPARDRPATPPNGSVAPASPNPPPPLDTPWWRHCSMRAKVSGLVLFTATAGVLLGMLAGHSSQPTPLGLVAVALLGPAMVIVGQSWLVTPVDRLLRWVELQGDAASPTDLDHLPTHRRDEVGRISRALHGIAANAIRQRIQSGVLARRFDDKLKSATRHAIAKFRDEAMRDELTGLGNRKAFNEVGRAIYDRAHDAGDDLIAIAIDLDHFKRINDTLGHAAGDRVLALVGELIREDTRAGDVSVRLGGDEFVVLLQGATLERATAIAEQARRRFHQRVGGQIGPDAPHVDLSIGLASRRLDRAGDLDTLLDRADQRLYAAKRLGRGRTVVSDDASASGIWPSPSPASDATPAVDEW
ncbi:MAG: GGDEF domain-containing protein [Planctomycetota bacterium]